MRIMLLSPNKNSDPDLTILAAASVILSQLKKKKIKTISELGKDLIRYNKKSISLLEPSLELLFLLGLIEYHKKNDLVEYTK